ncbi:rhodanese-related sulfurtransferase [Candidatus Erwinia haradaeae]|uniref:tRNA uridine(34) hydroxylase n=1 Tax=Candidatus Erwinia haradaeae TaxID=1922217 RepID=A0A451DGG1_9GAMM|nr:rhodanese-related sulfurtransferase [Candidatus Erwinia haradaeae]VFP85715.1 UPF0176 protein YceA [Candidatus Erwinia haradaeae]
MSLLYNTTPNKELKSRLLSEAPNRITVSFYKYFTITNPYEFRDALYLALMNLKVFGRIYVAKEGINAQVSVPCDLYSKMEKMLHTFDPHMSSMHMNIALDDNGRSFWVLRLKVRPRLVADGITDVNFNSNDVGAYINAETVNLLQDDCETVFVDVRNYYEYQVGHFNKALSIPGDTFRQQLSIIVDMLKKYKRQQIVLYCTGGIRCEKASAWMHYHGYKKVYQIQGGVINYVRQARMQGLPVHFIGKNFVFDERMSERISQDILAYCNQCGNSCDSYHNCRNTHCHKLFIQCPKCAYQFNYCCSIFCMQQLFVS